MAGSSEMDPSLQRYRDRLHCSVPAVDDIFADCLEEARALLSERGVEAYLDGASAVCGLGRGTELVLIFLENVPQVAHIGGESLIPEIAETARAFSRTANAKAIAPFLATLLSCARRLEEGELLSEYFGLLQRLAKEEGGALVPLLERVDNLLTDVSLGGLKNWVREGLRAYAHQPHRIADWFSMQAPDSQAAFQRERHGTLFVDMERRLEMFLRAFWDTEIDFHPYSMSFDNLRSRAPFLDRRGIHLPDVYDDLEGVRGIDRYRALIAHLMAHREFTRPFVADNFSPFQQLCVEVFEDSRVEHLLMRRFPGLRRLWLRLHPVPEEDACPEDHSCVRHKLAMLSRALLDPEHPYTDPVLLDFVDRFRQRVSTDPRDGSISTDLGVAYLAKVHTPAFRQPKIWFKDTEVSYRDDNRYMWMFLEDTEDEDEFHSDHAAANPKALDQSEEQFFRRHHREWDYKENKYRPDWATVYEGLHPSGDPGDVDALLERHEPLAKRLKRVVEFLKPQQHVRVRYQEDGDELDLDVAIRSMVDFRSGAQPDPRIHMSQRHDGRNIAVLLLIDLSTSINDSVPGADSSVLQLSQEAVSLLSWAIDALGDRFAIAGFASNTRHEVRYLHVKGFSEPWGEAPKARIAAMKGDLSTRMGAVLRHGGQYLSRRPEEKKLLLLLSDGEPHDIDEADPRYLIEDTKKAVGELLSDGVHTHCVTLDANADDYVTDIFGRGYTVVDHVQRLPERLPQLFMSLTK
jgi:nitric oxide reductase NorD protein